MRKEFSQWIEQYGRTEPRFLFLTGDLGFAALEDVQKALGSRFLNMGVCEQNMVSVAAGLAHQGLLPLCYSIAPFAVFRPYEQIRLDVALHRLPVKIVGNGGGYGYGIMGASHHALEDLAVLSVLPGFRCLVPLCNADVPGACEHLFAYPGPAYLRLGFGLWPGNLPSLPAFAPVRKLFGAAQPKVTVAGIGPVLLNALPWLAEAGQSDAFAFSLLPLDAPGDEFVASVTNSATLLVLEEHAARGGLAEHLCTHLAKLGVRYKLHHLCATGYPNNLYGSQAWHQLQCGLDAASLKSSLAHIISDSRPQ